MKTVNISAKREKSLTQRNTLTHPNQLYFIFSFNIKGLQIRKGNIRIFRLGYYVITPRRGLALDIFYVMSFQLFALYWIFYLFFNALIWCTFLLFLLLDNSRVFHFSPRLTWRDIQALIVSTAQITSPVDEGWKRNGAGFHFNHKFGFGRLDADAMVEAAKIWQNIPAQRKCTAASGFDHQ